MAQKRRDTMQPVRNVWKLRQPQSNRSGVVVSALDKSAESKQLNDAQKQAKRESEELAKNYRNSGGESNIDKSKELNEWNDAQKKAKKAATEAAHSYKSAGDSVIDKSKEFQEFSDVQK
jgi:hypothetical protein